MKNTRRSLITSLVTLLLCSAMFVGSSFAWFTDTVSNTGNKIQAGTLKIDLLQDKGEGYVSIKDNLEPVFNSGEGTELLWEPGQTQVAYLAVANNGNLALKYNIILDVVDRETNEDLNQAMAGAFTYAVINQETPASVGGDWPTVKAAAVAPNGYNANLLTAIQQVAPGAKSARITAAPTGKLQPNDKDYFVIAIHMDEEAGNAYQAGLIEFDVNVVATQLNSEEDGFDSLDYDKDATYPGLAPMINTSKTKTVTSKGQELAIEDEYAKSEIPAAVEDVQIISTNDEDKKNFAMETNSDLTRNIKTKNATEDSVVVDIGYVYTETTDGVTKSYDVTEFNGVVKNTVKLSAGLKNVEVTHSHGGTTTPMTMAESETSGEDGKFYYNDATGKLTIWSSKYSDFIVKYDYDFVAAIGTKGYTSLEDAIGDVKKDETVKVLKNIILTKELHIDNTKEFILDLNGKTISNAETDFEFTTTNNSSSSIPARFAIVVEDEGKLTICSSNNDGKINIKDFNYGTTKAILVKEKGSVIVNSGTVYGDYAAFYAVGYTGLTPLDTDQIPSIVVNGGKVIGNKLGIGVKGKTATVTINDGYVSGNEYYGISTNGTTDWYDGGNCKITINGGQIISNKGNAIYNPAESVVTINGGLLQGKTCLGIKGGNVTVNGGKFVATGEKEAPSATSSGISETGDALYVEDTYDNHKPNIVINGGTFETKNGFAVQYYTNKTSDKKGSVALYGGTYNTNPSEYVAEDYEAVKDAEKDIWTVQEWQPKSGSVDIPSGDTGYHAFMVGDRQFVVQTSFAYLVADGFDKMTLTLTETTDTTGDNVCKFTIEEKDFYYNFETTGMRIANDEGDPNFNLLIVGEDAHDDCDVDSFFINETSYYACGFGYGTTWGEYKGFSVLAIAKKK